MNIIQEYCNLTTNFKDNELKVMWLEGALIDLGYFEMSGNLPHKAFSNFATLTEKEKKILTECINYIKEKQV